MTQQSTFADREREFSFTHEEFKKLTSLVYSLTGIVLGDHKKDMVYGRLARRLRELGMRSFSQYCDLLDSKRSDEETGFLVNAITTNLTKFYRESHHFESLAAHAQKSLERSQDYRTEPFWSGLRDVPPAKSHTQLQPICSAKSHR